MAVQREWLEKDYYKVLGVDQGATDAVVTKAYRSLAKRLHPDANPGDAKAEERFKEVSAAYDVLGDATKRREYDEARRLGASRGGAGGFGSPGGGGPGFRVDDLSNLFGDAFSRGGRGTGRRTAGGPQRGEDLDTELHLSFREAIDGIETAVHLTSDAACETCDGTGAAPGTSPVICSQCGGRGVNDDNQGLFGFSRPCNTCKGTGMRVETPCKSCVGSGIERRPRRIKVRVQPGAVDGQRLRFKQRGGAGLNGGPPGDLYVTVKVATDARFGRTANDLTLVAPITFPEACLGASVTVPTLDNPVTLKIPPGTRSGRTFRVRGRGIAAGSRRGDLLITVEVAVPTTLTEAQRAAVEALATATTDNPRQHLGDDG